jgi:ubiquitin carboxyl-terminal hydrolase 16
LIPTKPAPLLRATSRLRTVLNQVKTAPEPVDLDVDKINLPAQVEWKRLKVPAIKTTTVSRPPQVLAIHLVRSVYERGYGAGRNGCEVTFDEDINIPMGGADVEQRRVGAAVEEDEEDEFMEKYRLRSVVTHKGWHDSGHYLCYRRRKRDRKPHRERSSMASTLESKDTVTHEVQEITEEKAVEDKGEESEGVAGLGFEEEIAKIDKIDYSQRDSRTRWWEISDEVVLAVNRSDVLSKRKGVYILFYERTV